MSHPQHPWHSPVLARLRHMRTEASVNAFGFAFSRYARDLPSASREAMWLENPRNCIIHQIAAARGSTLSSSTVLTLDAWRRNAQLGTVVGRPPLVASLGRESGPRSNGSVDCVGESGAAEAKHLTWRDQADLRDTVPPLD